MSASGFVHFDVVSIEAETDKALLFDVDGHDELVWVPKSVIADVDDYGRGDVNCTVSVREWWVEKNGLADLGREE